MSKKKNKTIVTPPTTEELINNGLENLSSDVHSLTVAKESALDVFKGTATKLYSINQTLTKKVETIDSVIARLTEEKKAAEAMIADNTAVRDKILAIIGD